MPLLLAATAVAAALGLLGPLSQIWPLDQSATSVVLLVGLAVGVDYSMFYLRREREERARGNEAEASLEAAAATSGRAVLVSGVTVAISMAGMFLAGASTFTSFAVGTITVVAIAVLGSLTVLPAVLSALGDRVNKGRVPFLTPPEERAARDSRVWAAILDPVLRRPVVSTVLAAGLLLVLAIPVLNLKMAVPGIETLPKDLEVIQTYDRIQAAFPGNQIPAEVVIEQGDASNVELTIAVHNLREAVEASDRFEPPVTVDFSADHIVAVMDVPIVGDGTNDASYAALAELRDEIIPATVDPSGAEANVTGLHRRLERLQRTHGDSSADRVRVRSRLRLPPAARDVPLDRDPDQGDPAQPALGRRGLWDRGLHLPGGPLRVAARLRVDRRDHLVAAVVPVRAPVRALDGLPRVHPQPGPRGLRRRPVDRGGGQPGHQAAPPRS